jgi:hypothetical protein
MQKNKFMYSFIDSAVSWATSIARLPILSLGGMFTGFFS